MRVTTHPKVLSRRKIKKWLKGFVKKLKRETTRGDLDRLILSVESLEFDNKDSAGWDEVIFENEGGKINSVDDWGGKISERWSVTSLQKKILASNNDFERRKIKRSELKEENGRWFVDSNLCAKVISTGGEAIVLKDQFGDLEVAVRVQVFDTALFTKKEKVLRFDIHLSQGRVFLISNDF